MARLFVALHPPLDVARALLARVAGLDLPPHRVTPETQVHLTLAFLGEVPEADLEETCESIRRAAAGVIAFALCPMELVALPERGPARLIAANTDAPAALLELRRRLVARLVPRPRREAAFRPHLTLCRFRAPTRYALPATRLESDDFQVESISLQRSLLLPTGAEHREVTRVRLPGA